MLKAIQGQKYLAMNKRWPQFVVCLLIGGLVGCAAPRTPGLSRWRQAEAAARPILEMNPDANWTACYNKLFELESASIDYLLARPEMRRRAAPDDLCAALCTSLLRLLSDPSRAPRISMTCFETTLDVLHLHPKVLGRSLGQVHIPPSRMPTSWTSLYPRHFNHVLARAVDIESDRRIMLYWWQLHRGEADAYVAKRRLEPKPAYLWPVMSRRRAEVLVYELTPEVILCAQTPGSAALFREKTCDYNLVRAVCIWLGSSDTPPLVGRLIEMVGGDSDVASRNALFALKYSQNPRIHKLLNEYITPGGAAIPKKPRTCPVANVSVMEYPSRRASHLSSCRTQGSAEHEMGQIHTGMRGLARGGYVYSRALWGDGSTPIADRSRSVGAGAYATARIRTQVGRRAARRPGGRGSAA